MGSRFDINQKELYMDIEHLRQTIKSNLVSYGLLVYQIEEITESILRDVLALMVKDDEI
jgi:hypothetical protein